jgi:death on curing protein
MNEPTWLTTELVIQFHQRQLKRFGGPEGLRDRGLLESAIERPRNKWAYEQCDIYDLAAAYAFGIARNHPFTDGNKRAAFLAIVVFLSLNGLKFKPKTSDAINEILELAAGNRDEAALARWIRANTD